MQVFNEWLMRPSHGDHQSAYAHLRILDINKWVNSKIFFKCVSADQIACRGSLSEFHWFVATSIVWHADITQTSLCVQGVAHGVDV